MKTGSTLRRGGRAEIVYLFSIKKVDTSSTVDTELLVSAAEDFVDEGKSSGGHGVADHEDVGRAVAILK